MTQFLIEALVTLVLLGFATAAIWIFVYLAVWRLWFGTAYGAPSEVSESFGISVLITVLFAIVLLAAWAAAADMWTDEFATKPGAVFVAVVSTLWAAVGIKKFRGRPVDRPSMRRDASRSARAE